jgi:hypothetical protein
MQESVFCSSRRASMNRINGIEIKKTPSLLPAQPPSSFPDSDHQHSTVCRSTFWLVFSVFYILSFWTAAPAAEVTDLIINNARGHLLLSLKIHDAFAKKPEKPATNEVSSTIVFSIVLYQINNFWFDKKITHQTATNTLKYDPLIKEYRLMHSWSSGPPLVVTDLDQAEKLLTEVKDLKVVALSQLEKDKNYQIRVQAVCQDKNSFFFGPSGCFKTDWYTMDFTF